MVEAWAFDEHRLGLKPIIRRIWAPKGQRPKARARPRYQWLYLYAYVQPQTGPRPARSSGCSPIRSIPR